MFWIVAITLGLIYLAAVAVVLLFFAGAALRNERWDQANDALWRAHRNEGRAA